MKITLELQMSAVGATIAPLSDMPSRRDNDEERIARLEHLMEEYRVNHEDAVQNIERAMQRIRLASAKAKALVKKTRHRKKR